MTKSQTSPLAGGIGASVPRVEDAALLRGEGCFIDDINRPGQLYAHFVRSPVANAVITARHLESALALDGVVAVFGPDDLRADGAGILHAPSGLKSADGTPIRNPDQLALTDHPRFVGDTLAMVLGESPEIAAEGALAVGFDYEESDAVVDPIAALAADAPVVWEDFGTNLALDWRWGQSDEVDAVFARASHVVEVSETNNRIMITTLETRGAIAEYDRASGRYTVWTPTQGGTQVQLAIADPGLGVAPSQVRVITPDVGGGFGIKNGIYSEQLLVAWAARRSGRPIKWVAERTDACLTDYHARDHRMRAELALDSEGHFLAIRSDVISNMGAYLTGAAPIIPTQGGTRMLPNVYRIPLACARARCVYTHTAPISAFRGAGKPEYAHLVERLVDHAADVLGIDPTELRERNFVGPQEMPWETPTGMVYDSGDFAARMRQALEHAGPESLGERRAQARGRGKLLGFGFSVYTEPDGFKDNRVEMSFDPSGHLTVITSAQTNGQGHATAYTQMAQSLLGVARKAITIVEGDTDRTGFASGSGGSRSTTVTGAAMHFSAERLIEKGTELAAHLLEASAGDIEFEAGTFAVAGTDRRVGWTEVAKRAHQLGALPPGMAPGLEAHHHYDAPVYCFPSGCHACEVEIDTETGELAVVRYVCASDFGTVVNPMMVQGQLHGGIVQGLGQAVLEHTVYDPASGQLLSGSFADYCIPRASDVPNFDSTIDSTRCTTNPLGVKGCGESGPTAALPAIANAVNDALAGYDRSELSMPYTAERLWRILRRPPAPT